VECLIDTKAMVNVHGNYGGTPFTYAASTGSVRTLELLILARADVKGRDSTDSQAIHFACRHKVNIRPVKAILRAGASVNGKNKSGQTPFAGVAVKNSHEIGVFLLTRLSLRRFFITVRDSFGYCWNGEHNTPTSTMRALPSSTQLRWKPMSRP